MDLKAFGNDYLTGLKQVLDEFDLTAFDKVVRWILDAYENQDRIFVMGNGGSASTASHFVADVNKGCCMDLDKKFKMVCLNDSIPCMLAYANDVSYEAIFVEQMKNLFEPGDLVIGISGSGNSENVLRAIHHAGENGGRTIGFSGYSGGKLAEMVDVPFVARVDDMQKVEDVHMIIVHMVMQALFRALNGRDVTDCG